jgi:hypothetical protein
MTRARLVGSVLVLTLLSGLLGCDVAVVAILASRNNKKSTNSTPPPPDTRYFVYGATLTGGTEATEKGNIVAAGGNPGGNWTLLGGGTATADFPFSTGMNAVLVQTTLNQAYDIDAVEGHDASDNIVSTFTTTNFSDQVTNTNNIAGFPDGTVSTAQATSTQNAFIFQILPASATTVKAVRVFISPNGGTRASGDPNWNTPWTRGGDQIPGGAASNSVGTTFFGATDIGSQAQWVLGVDASGNLQTGGANPIFSLEAGTLVGVGSISVAVDSGDHVIVANVTTSDISGGSATHCGIRWRKLNPGITLPLLWPLTAVWDIPFAGTGMNLVGSNGVVVDSAGNVLIAGGNDVGSGSSKNGRWLQKVDGAGGGFVWNQTGPSDTNSTWWRGVAIGPGDAIVSTGDVTTAGPGPVEIFTRTTNTGNTSTSDATFSEAGVQADLGQAAAVDGSGSSYVGGNLGVSGPSKNAVILKTLSGSTAPAQWFVQTANAPSEILGLRSLSDGTIYAVGYETVAANNAATGKPQGQNFMVLKIDPAGNVLWKRTYDSGQGDDQAVSAALTSTSLVVVGQVSTASGAEGKDVFVISYAR